ncbi:MAG: hypothetical protein QNJ94_06595 [Alphaproteobacteria bacterium]|nr:hypothetical protein [Alphaproteobacteria bacterium]
MARDGTHATLGVISFGLALGVTAAVFVFILGVVAGLFGWGVTAAQVLSSLFIGYGPTFPGAIAGAVWAFVEGLVAGMMVAFLYNRFLLRRQYHLAAPHREPAQSTPQPPETAAPQSEEKKKGGAS